MNIEDRQRTEGPGLLAHSVDEREKHQVCQSLQSTHEVARRGRASSSLNHDKSGVISPTDISGHAIATIGSIAARFDVSTFADTREHLMIGVIGSASVIAAAESGVTTLCIGVTARAASHGPGKTKASTATIKRATWKSMSTTRWIGRAPTKTTDAPEISGAAT